MTAASSARPHYPVMEDIIRGHEHNFSILPNGRCKCLLNGHVIPNTPQAVASFMSGRRYRQLCRMEGQLDKEQQYVLQGYEPYLTQSKNFPDRLFCRLTCRLLKRDLGAVQKYTEGKKYQHAKDLYHKDEHVLMSEPDLESDEDGHGADASEQTAQMGNGMSSSPTNSMQESIQMDDATAPNGSGYLESVDLDTDAGRRQQRVRPPRPKRQKLATAEPLCTKSCTSKE